MKVHRLYRELTVDRPRDELFAFFARPENLARITPPSMGFVILTPSPVVMKQGALIDYTVRIFSLPVRWTTLISDYDPPHRFIDVQLRGPYSFWHHTHTFEADGARTRVIDEVHYALPFGPLGGLLHRLIVRRQIEGIFDFRTQALDRLFPASSSSASTNH